MSVAEPAAARLETAAAERLYERNSSRVFGYCLKMLGTREEAEDASQTTFMQAFRALQRGVVPVFETAWLLAIAKNVCLARYRASGRRKAVELARDPQDLEQLAGGPERDDGSLVGLQDALGRLPEMQRRAFLLREWQGRSYAEIAHELGVTVPAVEALIFRARRALALELGGDERRRGHAFDIASLLAGLKSLLGGGAAVKVAVGAAAVVSAGAVAGGVVHRGETSPPAPAPAAGTPVSAFAPERREAGVRHAAGPSVSRERSATKAPVFAARHSTRPARRSGQAPVVAPDVPAGPAAGEEFAPQPGADAPPRPPRAPPATPATPAVPEPPAVPEAPALPAAPSVPLPEVPDLPVPKVELPPAPTDELPVDVPHLPPVPDVPGLPDLATLP